MSADEFTDVVHLSVNHEPPLFFTSRALSHFVPGEIAWGRPLGRGLGGHWGRATTRASWVAAVRRGHRTLGVARAGLVGSGSGSAGAGPLVRVRIPAARAPGFQPLRGVGAEPTARAPIGRGAWRGEQVPASPPAQLGRALQEGRGRRAAGRNARPLAGILLGSPPDPTFRLAPFAHRGRRGLDNGSCEDSWVRGPARGGGHRVRGRPGPLG